MMGWLIGTDAGLAGWYRSWVGWFVLMMTRWLVLMMRLIGTDDGWLVGIDDGGLGFLTFYLLSGFC